MRRELAAIGLAMAVLAVGYPIGSDGPYIDPPDLSWQHEGHTFHYRAYNATAEIHFNVTVDDVNETELMFSYWRELANGTRDVFQTWNISREDRGNLDLPPWKTFVWVEDLEAPTMKLGNHTYDLVESLPNSVYRLLDREFTFDGVNGYLIKAENTTSGETAELVSSYDGPSDPPNQEPSGPLCPPSHEEMLYGNDPGGHNFGTDSKTTVAEVLICWHVDGGNDECDWDITVDVGITWPLWEIEDRDYFYVLQNNGQPNNPEPKRWDPTLTTLFEFKTLQRSGVAVDGDAMGGTAWIWLDGQKGSEDTGDSLDEAVVNGLTTSCVA